MALFGAYRRLLKSEKPDIVITYTIKPNIYGGFACRLKRIPYCLAFLNIMNLPRR